MVLGSWRNRVLGGALCGVFLIGATLAGQSPVAGARSVPALRFVNSTGHTVSGPFLQYLDLIGGNLLGNPLSEPTTLDGANVQWFEYGRLDQTDNGGMVLGPVGVILHPTATAGPLD